MALTLGTILWAATVGSSSSHAAEAARSGAILGTADQIAVDRRAIEILAMPAVQALKKPLEEAYARNPQAAHPDGHARIATAVDAIMAGSAINAANSDPYRPTLIWDAAAPHDWNGVRAPASGYGVDNPDNIYRQAAIDGASRYEITGRIGPGSPAQESFSLYRTLPGSQSADTAAVREGAPILGTLTTQDIKTAPDGSFTIAIDGEPAGGRPNHLQSGDNPDEILIVRDTLSDWTKEGPGPLTIKRVGGPAPRPAPTASEQVDRAIRLMQAMVPFWIKYVDDYIFTKPINQIESPQPRDGGWGYASLGRFELADDEAMVVTVDPLAARYLGFQITDLWSITPEYIHHSASLNMHQAEANQDRTFTYVIAPKDPGVRNWIDTVGLHAGIIEIRWQELTDRTVSAARGIRSLRLVERRDLAAALPAGATRVSPSERSRLLSGRAASYARRLTQE